MAKNTPKTDRQVLTTILQPDSYQDSFNKTINETWGIDDKDLSVIYIAFLHHIEASNLANKIKWSAVAQDLPKECEEIRGLIDNAATYIHDFSLPYKSENDEAVPKMTACRQSLLTMARIGQNLQKNIEASVNDYTSVPRNLVQMTTNLESEAKSVAGLLEELTPEDDDKKTARWTKKCSEKMRDLTLHIKKVADKLNLLEGIASSCLDGTDRHTVIRLDNELRLYLLCRAQNKDQKGLFQETLTEEPSINTVISLVFGNNGPAHFRLAPANGHEPERKYHESKESRPRNVKQFEKVLKAKKWIRYENGTFMNPKGTLLDFGCMNKWAEMVEDYKKEGYELLYAYFPKDFRLKYICKKKDDTHTFELSFFAPPSSFGRSLRKKKDLADFLWDKEDAFDSMAYNAMVKALKPYGISLPVDELKKSLVDYLGARVKLDVMKLVAYQFTRIMKDDFEKLARVLAGDGDSAPQDDPKTLKDLFLKMATWRSLYKLRADIKKDDRQSGHGSPVDTPLFFTRSMEEVLPIATGLADKRTTDKTAIKEYIEKRQKDSSRNKLPLIGDSLDGWTDIVNDVVNEWHKAEAQGIPSLKRTLLDHAVDNFPMAASLRTDWSPLDSDALRTKMAEILTHQTDHILNSLYTSPNETASMNVFKKTILHRIGEALKSMDLSPYKKMFHDNLMRFYCGWLNTTYGRIGPEEADKIIWYGQDKEAFEKTCPSQAIKEDFKQKLCLEHLNGKDGEGIDDGTLDSLNCALLKQELKRALTTHPEKILEQYDFSMRLDEWRTEITMKTLRKICEVHVMDKLMANDKDAFKKVFYHDNGFREKIDSTIRTTWEIDKEKKEDFTAVVMTFVSHLTSRNAKTLAVMRRHLVDERAPYSPLPFLNYTEKVVKEWRNFKTEGAALAKLMVTEAKNYLTRGGKFKGERSFLKKLLDDDGENTRRQFLFGSPDCYDRKIKNVIGSLGEKSYRLPQNLLDATKEQLERFLLKDTMAFIQKYDFSNTLQNWLEKRTGDFIEDCPRILCMLHYNNVTPFLEEHNDTLAKIFMKNSPHRWKKPQRDKGGGTVAAKDETTTSVTDSQFYLILELHKDEMRALRNFQYESPLIHYVSAVAKKTSTKSLAAEIEERVNMPTTELDEAALADPDNDVMENFMVSEKERWMEMEELVAFLRKHRTLFSPRSDENGYLARLDIYLLSERKKEKEEIIEILVKKHHLDKNELTRKYDKWKMRVYMLVQEVQAKKLHYQDLVHESPKNGPAANHRKHDNIIKKEDRT